MSEDTASEQPGGDAKPEEGLAAAAPSPPTGAAPAPAAEAAPARPPAKPDVLPPPKATREFVVLCYTLLSFFLVTFVVWVGFAWSNYSARYSTQAEGWVKGGVRFIELTLVKEDAQNLSCASDVEVEGLHCGYRTNHQPWDPHANDDSVTLRPYNTVDNVLFLGAGLWSSPALAGPLPADRFTVVCNYHMVSALKSVATRWSPNGQFDLAKGSVPAGRLTDCLIPR
jgi:hypothetical protein